MELIKPPQFYSTISLKKSLLKDQKFEDLNEIDNISKSLQKRGKRNYSQSPRNTNRGYSSPKTWKNYLPSQKSSPVKLNLLRSLPSYIQFHSKSQYPRSPRSVRSKKSDKTLSGTGSILEPWLCSTPKVSVNSDMSRFKKVYKPEYLKSQIHLKNAPKLKQGINKLKTRAEFNRQKLSNYISCSNLK